MCFGIVLRNGKSGSQGDFFEFPRKPETETRIGALVTRGAFMPNLFLNEHIIQNKDGVQENRSGIPPDVFVPRFLRSWEEEGRRR